MKIPQIYFIAGVSGVGKTSAMKCLKTILPKDMYDIHDFDERGVPDGGGREWHDKETLHWLEVGSDNATAGKSTIISGFTEPARIKTLRQEHHPSVQLILLHASKDTVRQRLLGRESTPERIKEIERASGTPAQTFIEGSSTYAATLHAIFEKESLPIIVTDSKTPEEIAKEVIVLISI